MTFRKRHRLLRRLALGFAAAAITVPVAQAAPGPTNMPCAPTCASALAGDRSGGRPSGVELNDAVHYGAQRANPISAFRPRWETKQTGVIGFRGGGQLPSEAGAASAKGTGTSVVRGVIVGPAEGTRLVPFGGRFGHPQSGLRPHGTTAGGFDWSAAGAGFGVAAALAILAGGMAVGLRGSRSLATGQ